LTEQHEPATIENMHFKILGDISGIGRKEFKIKHLL